MNRVRLILRLIGVVTLILPWQFAGYVVADSLPTLIISEIKIRNDTTGFDEFIEIYNPTADPVSLNEYKISYINTPAPLADSLFTSAVIGDGLLEAGKSFILAKNNTDPSLPLSKNLPFSSLSDSGGTLRILDNLANTVDEFNWTVTQSLAIYPVYFLPNTITSKSQSFTRNFDADNKYVIVDPEWNLVTPTPVSNEFMPLPTPDPLPEPEPEPVPDPLPTPDPVENPLPQDPDVIGESTDTPLAPLLPIQITELLPNPASPASDSTDEYIELYNPNDEPVDLVGYKLQSGNTFSYSYTFPETSLAGFEYRAFFITETGDILANNGGQARLLDANGVVVAQTNAYDSADDGDAWSLINGAWQWTTKPTPNAVNELALPILKIATTKTPTPKKTVTKATKTAKPKKVATVKGAKTPKKSATPERQVYEDPAEVPPSLHPSVLAGVGVITLVYAVYEYRGDAFNAVKRFQRYREIRRATRPTSSGQ